MPRSEPSLPLTSFMAIEPLRSVTHKQLFGGEYVLAGDLWDIMGILYEYSALIGRRFKDDMPSLMRLLYVEPKNQEEMLALLKGMVEQRLQDYKQLPGSSSERLWSLYSFFIETEYAKAGLNLRCANSEAVDRSNRFKRARFSVKKQSTWLRVRMVGGEALCFGMQYPGLTWEILSRASEPSDTNSEVWKVFRLAEKRAGRAMPNGGIALSVEQEEAAALAYVSVYIQQMRPELTGMLERLEKGQSLPLT